MSSNLANNYDVLTLEQQIDDVVVEITQQETTIRSLMADDHEVINATTHLCHLIGKLTALLLTKVKPNMAAYSFLSLCRPLSAQLTHGAARRAVCSNLTTLSVTGWHGCVILPGKHHPRYPTAQ